MPAFEPDLDALHGNVAGEGQLDLPATPRRNRLAQSARAPLLEVPARPLRLQADLPAPESPGGNRVEKPIQNGDVEKPVPSDQLASNQEGETLSSKLCLRRSSSEPRATGIAE